MFKTSVKAGEIYRNETRPAIFESIRSVLKFYGLENYFDRIYFNDEAEVAMQINTDKEAKLRDNRQTDFEANRKLFIEAEIERSKFNSGHGNAGQMLTNTPIWYNDDCHTMIVPGYEGREITVRGFSHFRTRNEAKAFVNTLESLVSTQLAEYTFNAHVHYPFNSVLVKLLEGMHAKLVKAGKTNLTYAQWFFKNRLAPFDVITNEGNNNAMLVMQRRIDDINVIFNEPQIRLSRKGDYLGFHQVEFSYMFYWQEMVKWNLQYPLMVYQQPIDPSYIPRLQDNYRNGFIKNANIEYQLMNQIDHRRTKNAPFYYRFPDYDPWYPPDLTWLDPQIAAVVSLADVQTQIVGNIHDFPNWQWKKCILDHIIKYRDYVFTHHEDVIHIKVYSDDLQVLDSQLSMDQAGNIHLSRPPTMGNIYRLCLFADLDLLGLSLPAVDRIVADDEYKYGTLPCLFPWHNWGSVPNSNQGTGKWPVTNPKDGINSAPDFWEHAGSQDMGNGKVFFGPVFYQMDADLLAKK